MIQHEEAPKVGMTVIKIRSGSMYTVDIVEQNSVYLRPYWSGRGSRSTWKTRTHLWRDYRRVDETAVQLQPNKLIDQGKDRMSIMTKGIIQQHYRLAMCTENSRRQFHSHAQVLLADRDQLKAENEALRKECARLAEDNLALLENPGDAL